MRQLVRIATKLYAGHWAIKDSVWKSLSAQFLNHISKEKALKADDFVLTENDLDSDETSSTSYETFADGRIALLSIEGILGKKLGLMESACGGVDTDAISMYLDEIATDEDIESVILQFDSPGGSVPAGVAELAEQINDLSETKDVYAYTDTMACSAAYWLMSQAPTIYVSKGAEVGSVGVYNEIVQDPQTSANTTLIKDGKYKGIGIKPLSESDISYLTAECETIGAMLRGDIKAMRGDIDDADLQGQSFYGKDAVAKGFADGICNSVTDLIDALSSEYEADGDDDSEIYD